MSKMNWGRVDRENRAWREAQHLPVTTWPLEPVRDEGQQDISRPAHCARCGRTTRLGRVYCRRCACIPRVNLLDQGRPRR